MSPGRVLDREKPPSSPEAGRGLWLYSQGGSEVRLLIVLSALLMLALPASAQFINLNMVPLDRNYQGVTQTFMHFDSTPDSVSVKVDNDTLDWSAVIPLSGYGGWFNFQFTVEATAQSARFVFSEAVVGTTLTHAWGDTVNYYLGGLAKRDAFQIGMANSFKVAVTGTNAAPNGRVELFWWVEGN